MNEISVYLQNLLDSINTHELVKSIVIFSCLYVIFQLIKSFFLRRLLQVAKATTIDIDDLVAEILNSLGFPFYFFLSLYLSVEFTSVSGGLSSYVGNLSLIIFIFYAIKTVSSIINYAFTKALSARKRSQKEFDPSVMRVLRKLINMLIWVIAILFILQNLGYDVSTLIGGLGVAGIAVAFGVQSLLEDVVSYFSIYFDKPFRIGDFIVVGEDMGEVERIGLKSTRIRTLRGEELVVSNKELTNVRINNFRRMDRRREEFRIGVTYDTSSKKLKSIPAMINDIISSVEFAEMDRAHFKTFGDSSLLFEIVYFVDTSDYDKYMDIQQEINLKIVEAFEKEKIEIAYPTQTVYIEKQI